MNLQHERLQILCEGLNLPTIAQGYAAASQQAAANQTAYSLNSPGFHGGYLVKVKPRHWTFWQVADSNYPQPRQAEYTRLTITIDVIVNCSKASSTKSVCIELLTRQPTIRRANTSITNATYIQPCQVDT